MRAPSASVGFVVIGKPLGEERLARVAAKQSVLGVLRPLRSLRTTAISPTVTWAPNSTHRRRNGEVAAECQRGKPELVGERV